MDGPEACIIDDSTVDLNTIGIQTDHGMMQVPVCAACADSVPLSKIKQAYIEWQQKQAESQEAKQRQIAELMAKAKELGLELAVTGAAVPATPQIQAAQAQTPTQTPEITARMGGRLVDGKVADNHYISTNVDGSVSYQGSTVSGGGAEYTIKSSTESSTDLKAGEIAEVAPVKGRLGTEVVIPVRRIGPTGETIINIIDSGGDAGLQRRFKNLANNSQSGNGPYDFIHNGYQVKTIRCPLCGGQGSIQGGKKSCPKCNGMGSIDIEG